MQSDQEQPYPPSRACCSPPLPWALLRRGDVPQFLGDRGHQCQAGTQPQPQPQRAPCLAQEPLYCALLGFWVCFAFPCGNKLVTEEEEKGKK